MVPARLLALAVFPFGVLVAGGAALAAESAYTTLDLDACTVLSRQEEGGSVELKCSGLGGVSVFFSEGDLRTDVDFGAPDGRFSTFGPFNNIAGKIEWRHAGGKPFAAIVRFNVSSGTEGQTANDVLLVLKVGSGGAPGCPVAIVDVGSVEQANGVARGAAALAPGVDCGRAKPVVIGAPDSLAASFSEAVPEGQ